MDFGSIRESIGQLHVPKPRQRAEELYNEVAYLHERARARLKDDESIDLLCTAGTTLIHVDQLGYVLPDFISVEGQQDEGTYSICIFPVEQVAFSIVISKKVSDQPRKPIGFGGDRGQESSS